MAQLYRLFITYDTVAPKKTDTCVADEKAHPGSVFYGPWGRAIVDKCRPIDGHPKTIAATLAIATERSLRNLRGRAIS